MTTSSGPSPAPRRWWRASVSALCGAAFGALAAWLQPRGPVTATEALALLAGGLATGLIAGAATRSRWAIVLTPIGFLLLFELLRLGSTLPTVGPLDATSAFGVLAFVLGRIVAWPLVCLSVTVGALWGIGRPGLRIGLIVATAITALIAGSLLMTPSSPPVRDARGAPVVGEVSELIPVEVNGREQWIEVRGASDDLPILLYLSGGPGQSDLAYSRVLFEPLAQDFLVVGWDQRGTGKSYPALDPETLTLDGAVADTVELARWLTHHYGQEKVYLLGESWGSLLGVLAVREAPELFHAFVGSGQMVAPLETDEGIYRDLVTTAMGTGDGALIAKLTRMGPPPYRSVFGYARIMSLYPLLEGPYTPPADYLRRGRESSLGPYGIFGREYSPIEKVSVLRGLLDVFSVLYPQLQDVDLRRDAATLSVPLVVLAGEHELAARTAPAREWFDSVEAPAKQWIDLPDAGHSVAFEQAGELRKILLELDAD